LKKDKMSGTADGQEFRYSLNDTQKDGLSNTNF